MIRRITRAGGLHHRRLLAAGLPAGHARAPRRRAKRRFNAEVAALDNIISADWVAGEIDAMLMIVARDVAELHVVLSRPLDARRRAAPDHAAAAGGAQASLAAAHARDIRPIPARGLNTARERPIPRA